MSRYILNGGITRDAAIILYSINLIIVKYITTKAKYPKNPIVYRSPGHVAFPVANTCSLRS